MIPAIALRVLQLACDKFMSNLAWSNQDISSAIVDGILQVDLGVLTPPDNHKILFRGVEHICSICYNHVITRRRFGPFGPLPDHRQTIHWPGMTILDLSGSAHMGEKSISFLAHATWHHRRSPKREVSWCHIGVLKDSKDR